MPSTQNGARGGGFSHRLLDVRPGICVFEVIGKGAEQAFENEPGGHRWQRVPPNEKRGRVHTSTVTVAVLPEPTETQVVIREQDLEITTCRGSGPGGQHKNKTDSAVRILHRPTGFVARSEAERSQRQNKINALNVLRAKIWACELEKKNGARSVDRKLQVGSGMRGDKRRTVRSQDGQVWDHPTGQQWRYKDYVRGEW